MPGSSPGPVCARVISLPSTRILSMETGRFGHRTDVNTTKMPTSACGTCGSTTMIRRRRQRGPLLRRRPRHQLRRVRLRERRRRRVRLPGHRHRRSRLPGPHLRRNPLFCICRSYCAEVTWEITLRSGESCVRPQPESTLEIRRAGLRKRRWVRGGERARTVYWLAERLHRRGRGGRRATHVARLCGLSELRGEFLSNASHGYTGFAHWSVLTAHCREGILRYQCHR